MRVPPKVAFPLTSIAVLALITAAIWSLVASREASHPGRHIARQRMASDADKPIASESRLR